jgi:hypothetical protein
MSDFPDIDFKVSYDSAEGPDEVLGLLDSRLERLKERITSRVAAGLHSPFEKLRERIADNLQGGKVNVRSGALAGSLEEPVSETEADGTVHGTLSMGKDIAHAVPLELGAIAHVISARDKRALMYEMATGEKMFSASVQHPGLRARNYFGDPVEAMASEFRDAVHDAVMGGIDDFGN